MRVTPRTGREALAIALSLLALGSCRTASRVGPSGATLPPMATTFPVGTPSHVTPGALDAVVVLQSADRKRIASAIAVSERHLLTARHVVADRTDESGAVAVRVDGELETAQVVAQGLEGQPHGDWALLELPRRLWLRIATIHPAALEDGWAPEPGAEILLVGYAAGFYRPDPEAPEGTAPPMIDVDAPTPSVAMRMDRATEFRWLLKGEPLDLGGMSGGGAMIWNGELGRAELVGVFSGFSSALDVETTEKVFAGVVLLSAEVARPAVRFIAMRLPAPELVAITAPAEGD